MTLKRNFLFILFSAFLFLASVPLSAQENTEVQDETAVRNNAVSEKEKRLTFSITANGVYIFGVDHVSGSGDNFAPVTGIYGGLQGQIIACMDIRHNTPLGDHWLLRDANLIVTPSVEITPVSLAAGLRTTFTPFPFLSLQAGGQVGKGWDCGPFTGGLSKLGSGGDDGEPDDDKWHALGFNHSFIKGWAQATLMFDTGIFFPDNERAHIVMAATYQVYYSAVTGVRDGYIWQWNCDPYRTNGVNQWVSFFAGYQMPLKFSMAGIMFQLEQLFDPDAFAGPYKNYKSDFAMLTVSPMAVFEFNRKDSLLVMVDFASRRRFSGEYDYPGDNDGRDVEPKMRYSGREWYLRRIAFSYIHKF